MVKTREGRRDGDPPKSHSSFLTTQYTTRREGILSEAIYQLGSPCLLKVGVARFRIVLPCGKSSLYCKYALGLLFPFFWRTTSSPKKGNDNLFLAKGSYLNFIENSEEKELLR